MERKGAAYLKAKLEKKRGRVKTRYQYYEMKNAIQDFNIVKLPARARDLTAMLGWCGKAVDSLADRLVFQEFREDNYGLNEIYALNNADILFDNAVLSALISSCCFIYISAGADGYPRLQVIDGGNATGIINPITNLLEEGYAVLERDDRGQATLEAYFVAGRTDYFPKGEQPYSYTNNAPAPLLVPVIYRPDAVRPFGHSRISRAMMSIVQGALRTVRRSEISAEFYSFPQKYVLGTSQDAEPMEKWQATISSFLQFTKDDEGDKPSVGQFTQQSMSPYTEQLRTFAAMFAGETGLTLDDLGFVTDNPSSAEAIKASHENLRLSARKAQRTFGVGFLNAGYLAACVRDNYPYQRNQLYQTKVAWSPVFEPDAAMLAAIGDGVGKLNQAVPGYITEETMRDLTGV